MKLTPDQAYQSLEEKDNHLLSCIMRINEAVLNDNIMRNYAKAGGKEGRPGYRTPSSFMGKVFAVVAKIPKGKTMTYKEVAQKIGNPKSYRAVGNALNKNIDSKIPCHRVVRSNGSVGDIIVGEKKLKLSY